VVVVQPLLELVLVALVIFLEVTRSSRRASQWLKSGYFTQTAILSDVRREQVNASQVMPMLLINSVQLRVHD